MIVDETPIEVRYAETDQMGIVHHSNYALYCELGRVHLCDRLGIPYKDMEARGIYLMVAEMTTRFKAPARYGDSLLLKTWISTCNRRMLIFDYEMAIQGQPKAIFTGNSKHIFTKRTEGPTIVPQDILDRLTGETIR